MRKRTLGNYRPSHTYANAGRITISWNPDLHELFLTLLHELAHALVYAPTLEELANFYDPRSNRFTLNGSGQSINTLTPEYFKIRSHGREWRSTFRQIILEALELFPFALRLPLQEFSQNPTAGGARAYQLQKKFQQHHLGTPPAPQLADLAEGATFQLANGLTLIKLRKLRSYYRCASPDRTKFFRVHPSAEVTPIPRPPSANGE